MGRLSDLQQMSEESNVEPNLQLRYDWKECSSCYSRTTNHTCTEDLFEFVYITFSDLVCNISTYSIC